MRKKIIIILIGLVIIIAFLIYFDKYYLILEAVDTDNNIVLCSKIIKRGGSFSLRFRNSISKTIVEEKFEVIDVDYIKLSALKYQSCDAGYPTGYNCNFTIKDNYMIIKDINKVLRELRNIRIATCYPHYLIIGDFKYNLSAKAAGNTLSVKAIKIFKIFRK